MPDMVGINYNVVKPRPTYEELIQIVYDLVKYLDYNSYIYNRFNIAYSSGWYWYYGNGRAITQ